MRALYLLGLVSVVLFGTAAAGELKGTVKVIGVKTSADAVIYVEAVPGKTFAPPKDHAVIDQKNLVFTPHVLPVLVGTTVDFHNGDAVLHNVFSPDKCCGAFNLGSWPEGESRSFLFKDRCVSTLLCKVHPEMEGYVLALPTPWFAVTDKTGAYSIKDLPDGTYTVKVWHEKVKTEASQTVKIAGPTTANFELKK